MKVRGHVDLCCEKIPQIFTRATMNKTVVGGKNLSMKRLFCD